MRNKNCKKCTEGESEHRCYVLVDGKYFEEEILDAFFVRCGLCYDCAGLRAVRDGGDWVRVVNVLKQDFSKGFICPLCAKGLGL